MISRVNRFIRKPTSIDVIINTGGNYLNILFTALFAIVLVRVMTPAEYGVLSVMLGISYVLANALDFGTTATIYSYLPTLLEKRTAKLYEFVKTMFLYQSLFAVLAVLILSVTFPWLDKVFFKTGAAPSTMYLTLAGVLLFIWQNFISNILLAAKKYLKVNLYVNVSNLVKTVVLFAMIPFGAISVSSVIFVFSILGSLLFFLPLFIEKRSFIPRVISSRFQKDQLKFGYTFTYFISTQFYNLALRMDLFLLSYFGLRNEVGYYGLAQKIILSIITTIISITQVLSPHFSKANTQTEARKLIKPGLMYLSIPAGIFVLLYFTPASLFQIVFTNKFQQTAAIAKSLAFPYVLFSYSNFLLIFMLYSIKKPAYVLVSNLLLFAGMTIGCYLLIPRLGVFAPSYIIAGSLTIASVFLGITSLYEYKKLPQ